LVLNRVREGRNFDCLESDGLERDILVHRPQRRRMRYKVEPVNRMADSPALTKNVQIGSMSSGKGLTGRRTGK
jgi:hypothetical protein